MSILPYCPLAAAAEGATLSWLLIVLTALAIGAAFASGILPPGKLPGPNRIPAERSAWPLAGVLFGAMGFYLFAMSALMKIWEAIAPTYGATTQPFESEAGIALLNTLPPVLALIGLLIGNRVIHVGVEQKLGLKTFGALRGILIGAGAGILVLPPLYLASQIFEWIYRSIQYEHPTEHPLLHVLGEGPNLLVKVTIIVGACIVAPFWEELVFRGHVQTLLLRTIQWLAGMGHENSDVPPAPPDGPESLQIQYQRPVPQPRAWMSWLAIFITSTLFAAIHPLWSAPIIFILAVFLGYAYERTGNLWVSITMHAMFNIISTILFLAGAGSH